MPRISEFYGIPIYMYFSDHRHKDVQTTIVSTHVVNRGGREVHSPLDRLGKAASTERSGMIRAGRSASDEEERH